MANHFNQGLLLFKPWQGFLGAWINIQRARKTKDKSFISFKVVRNMFTAKCSMNASKADMIWVENSVIAVLYNSHSRLAQQMWSRNFVLVDYRQSINATLRATTGCRKPSSRRTLKVSLRVFFYYLLQSFINLFVMVVNKNLCYITGICFYENNRLFPTTEIIINRNYYYPCSVYILHCVSGCQVRFIRINQLCHWFQVLINCKSNYYLFFLQFSNTLHFSSHGIKNILFYFLSAISNVNMILR